MKMDIDSLVRNEGHWNGVKQRGFPHLRPVYFAWASIGATIEAASDEQIAAMRRSEGRSVHSVLELLEETECHRRNIAQYLNAKPEEVFFHQNTTNALYAILSLLLTEKMLKAGDEILTTTKEFDTTLLSLGFLKDRYDISTVFVEEGEEGKDGLVDAMKNAITPKTRAILLSDVTFETCERLPVEEVVKLAREYGIIPIIDSAQSPGQIKFDAQAIGADYFATAGHKWMTGPLGTGMAVIRNPQLVNDPMLTLMEFSGDVFALPLEHLRQLDRRTIEAFADYGATEAYERFAGLSKAVDFHREVGDASFARIRYLTEHFRAQLMQMPQVKILTPTDAPTGMTSFTVEGENQKQVVEHLDEKGFAVSHKPRSDLIRVATHYTNTTAELDALCAELKAVAR
ncbi:MAG: aminotransferase class V-fold PLP-dependent enzyme [Nanoarchaeota archaeon]